jgi:hypothetical protein
MSMIANRVAGAFRGRAAIFACGAALMAALGFASSASAANPFEVFSDCPLTTAHVKACVYAETTSGKFTVGSTTVPISKTIILQGGVISKVTENAKKEVVITEEFVAAKDGNTLSKTPLNVPGGLAGLVDCPAIENFFERVACEWTFENGLTGVTATTELAAPASSIGINEGNLLDGTGTALSLPVKVKLSNPLLGEECYIGSNSNPVTIALTTGKSGSVTGSTGKVKVVEGLLTDEGNSLVNNTFTAPEVEGCGEDFSFLIDPIVNAKLDLPSGSGHNTAVLDGTLKQAGKETVEEELA